VHHITKRHGDSETAPRSKNAASKQSDDAKSHDTGEVLPACVQESSIAATVQVQQLQ
jgi:hypothetical protein